MFLEAGEKPNIVPARAVTEWMVRSHEHRHPRAAEGAGGGLPRGGRDRGRLRGRASRGRRSSTPTCSTTRRWWRSTPPTPTPSAARWRSPHGDAAVVGSTDMGNVSYLVPSIHPMIAAAPSGLPIHTPEFASHARAESGDRAVVDGAVALAWTVADLWLRRRAPWRPSGPSSPPPSSGSGRSAQTVRDRGGGRRLTYGSRRPPGPADDRLHRRGVHARRGGHPPALLHEPRRSRVRAGEPARGREGGALRPLLPQLQEPAAALPRRVRRRPRHQRRRHHRRHRGPAPGRGALRPGVLRVRRRLRRPARRGPPGLRAGVEPAHQGARVGPADGLPRAVHPLHRLRHPARRPLPLLPRPRGARLRARASATSATWTASSTPTPSWCR